MNKKYEFSDTTQLSPHFNAKEFRCKCGKEHEFMISNELIEKLEKLYAALNCSKIIVTSGFRCSAHDKTVGGSGTGQHTLGNAADICCYGQDGQPISSKVVCCKAQDIGFRGIANITAAYQYTHVDVRPNGKWYGDEVHGNSTVTDDFYKYFGGEDMKGIDVSVHNGDIDWGKVKADGIDFAIIRAGFGRLEKQKDEKFEQNYAGAKSAGIPVGAYWYSYAMTPGGSRTGSRCVPVCYQGKAVRDACVL
ncbi:GH25 family lysozyme [Ruminococcus sp.]|uniref:D-Ala-D-Ala carboxypeptidase family metallohydrolase n=1 Tax=Ruminococcus sp. TaxID=41978 RepID=UPI002B8736EB|nr:GH25 family lysozyme [Ruminococcus sp.]HOA00612.1 GH25 family lysozyme [Ruminococcus sp.]